MADTKPQLIHRSSCLVVILSLLFLLTACAQTEREEALYQLIKHAAGLAERHDVLGLMDLTKEGFSADPGGHSNREVRRILFVTFKSYGKFRILYPKPVLKLSEDESIATVNMSFLIAKNEQLVPELEQLYQDPEGWLRAVGERAELYTLSLDLVFESGDWLVTKATITAAIRPHGPK